MFRTYNASVTLQNQLDLLTQDDMTIPEKLLAYNRANRAVAILCNHQRSVPKSHEKSMENLKEKIRQKREQLDDAENEYEVRQRKQIPTYPKYKYMRCHFHRTLRELLEKVRSERESLPIRSSNKLNALRNN